MMRPRESLPNCPYDGCPLKPFARMKAPRGCTIALHGCRFCNFNFVVAVATDASRGNRLVGQWSVSPTSGQYVIVKEYGPNPPAWLDIVRAALPNRELTKPVEFDEQGNPI